MSAPVSSTSTSLSADELREIVADAEEWFDDGAPMQLPEDVALRLSSIVEGYAEGVISERLRGRERREHLEYLLRRAYHALDQDWWHPELRQAIAAAVDIPGEARKAGLLEGGEK